MSRNDEVVTDGCNGQVYFKCHLLLVCLENLEGKNNLHALALLANSKQTNDNKAIKV